MTGNDFMGWVLRSPLHGFLSDTTMLITVKGRKTGRGYTTPVGYFMDDGNLWIVTSRDRTWWRNLMDKPEVEMLLKNRQVLGTAELELDQDAVQRHLHDYVKFIPQAAKPMGIHLELGRADAQDIARAARDRLFVKIRIKE